MSDAYVKYYLIQAGEGSNEDVFGPLLRFSSKYQRGRGLGGIFSGLFRYLKPILKSGLKYFGKEAIHTGADLISELVQKPVKEVLRDRSLKIVDNLRDKAVSKIQNMSGSGCKRSIGGKNKKKCALVRNRKKIINKRNGITGKNKKNKTFRNMKNIKNMGKGIKRKLTPKHLHSKKYRVLDIFS